MYRILPPVAVPPVNAVLGKAEYANSPAPSVPGLPTVDDLFILIMLAIFYFSD